jgi:Ca2+/H+ antiporter
LGFQAAVTTLLAATPIAVLLSTFVTAGTFALIFPSMMMFALLAAAFIGVLVVLDTDVVWLEGAALIIAYFGIVAAFWWG